MPKAAWPRRRPRLVRALVGRAGAHIQHAELRPGRDLELFDRLALLANHQADTEGENAERKWKQVSSRRAQERIVPEREHCGKRCLVGRAGAARVEGSDGKAAALQRSAPPAAINLRLAWQGPRLAAVVRIAAACGPREQGCGLFKQEQTERAGDLTSARSETGYGRSAAVVAAGC